MYCAYFCIKHLSIKDYFFRFSKQENFKSMPQITRTNSENPDFIALVKHLDAELAVRDGEDHAFYAQFNKIDKIKFAVVVYEDGKPLGCGGFREFAPNAVEIKRMYVFPESRGKGIAGSILAELESWARELSYARCVLETGKNQPEAIRLYQKSGYRAIPNYGPYAGIGNSVCFEKDLV